MGTRNHPSLGGVKPTQVPPPTGQEAYRALVAGITDCAIFLMDEEGFIQTWNAGAEAVYGFTETEALGRNLSALYTDDEKLRGVPERALDTAARLGRSEDEGWRQNRDGNRFWARTVIHALRDEWGVVYGYGEIGRDLSDERRRAQMLRRAERHSETLREQAMRDPLTGAYNRRHLAEFLRGATERAEWTTASLLAIDLDNFKTINDRFGHDLGDEVLVGVSRLASGMLRNEDRLFRLGGDEFLVYLPTASLSVARSIAERLRDSLEQARLPEACPVTVSIGVAQLEPGDTAETWIQRADTAMYEAKRAGRNRVS